MDDLEQQLKDLIVRALKLEDLLPADIDSDEALFGDDGLGLDSIDALELGVAIRKTFDLKIETVTDDVRQHFATVRSLAVFIRQQKGDQE